ncbi:MAG: CBS domain-containing protein [Snowella sp.]|nr:CBS domain-containing protein [Snowella sp.]
MRQVPAILKAVIVKNPLTISSTQAVMAAILEMSNCRSRDRCQGNIDAQLAELWAEARSSCVVVLENDQVVGIFTEKEVLDLCAKSQSLNQTLLRDVIS